MQQKLTQTIRVTDTQIPVITTNGKPESGFRSWNLWGSFTANASATDNCSLVDSTGWEVTDLIDRSIFCFGETYTYYFGTVRDIYGKSATEVSKP